MKREIIIVEEEEIKDFTKQNCTWEIKGENYKYIDRQIYGREDGLWNKVIVQRESDQKYFQFTFMDNLKRSCFEYNDEWKQVEPKIITETLWDWNKSE